MSRDSGSNNEGRSRSSSEGGESTPAFACPALPVTSGGWPKRIHGRKNQSSEARRPRRGRRIGLQRIWREVGFGNRLQRVWREEGSEHGANELAAARA